MRMANWKPIVEACHARPEGQSAKQWLPQLCDAICAMWDENYWIPQESLGVEQLFNTDGDPRERPDNLT